MEKHFKLCLPDEGMDIYAPCEGMGWGYRYGPSIMVHDGICEAWFASPGAAGEADWFTYKKSLDGGKTWTTCETAGATPDKWVYWNFTYTAAQPGAYKLDARALTANGTVSPLASSIVFEVE